MQPPADGPGPLDEVEREFVDLWRSMSGLWGISPTMAQIHGLLFLTGDVMSMDDIMARLETSRGNVSMNLSKLTEWGLIRRVHRRGDRRDYYEALGDVWEMFAVVAAQRKRREIDPMLTTLRHVREGATPGGDGLRAAERYRRIDDLLTFLTLVDGLAQRFFASHKGLRSALDLLSQKPA
jgi:DNA-binding transcriptional regulator GbsR (MarR family)